MAIWTPEEMETARYFFLMGRTDRQISEEIGKSYHAVKSQIAYRRHEWEQGAKSIPNRPSCGNLRVVRIDDSKFVNSTISANGGYGFPVVTDPLLSRLDAFDRHPRQAREFWRAS